MAPGRVLWRQGLNVQVRPFSQVSSSGMALGRERGRETAEALCTVYHHFSPGEMGQGGGVLWAEQ